MPRRKSATKLEILCLEIVHQNLDTLQNAAKDLPLDLINDLHKKSVDHYTKVVRKSPNLQPPPLSTDLFFHYRTKATYKLHYYDQVPHRTVDLINRLCKNLQSVCLKEHLCYIDSIIINNPNILQMDLSESKCNDDHLKIIGRNCPQLQILNLFDCYYITDDGPNHLPQKLVDLTLPFTFSMAGSLNALQCLPHLKRFFSINWPKILKIIVDSPDNRFGDQKFKIEAIEVDLDDLDVCRIGSLFPNLRNLTCTGTSDSYFGYIVDAFNHDLLTKLTLLASSDCIKIVGNECPMLEEFQIQIVMEKNSDLYLATSEHIPFKYLCKLTVYDNYNLLALDDFFYLMVNCRLLSHLYISSFIRFTNQVMFDILRDNPLKCLEVIYFFNCGAFSGEALCELLKSLSSLWYFEISSRAILDEDKIKVQTLIEEMNWEMKLIWNYY